MDITRCFAEIHAAIEARYQRELLSLESGPRTVGSLVRAVLRTEFVSVYQIASRTGLELRQVRGVVNSVRMRSQIKKRRQGGVTEYYCPLIQAHGPSGME
jgi:hypothetical protein